MTRLTAISLGILLLAGCATTYELSPAPPGHPAYAEAPETSAEPSRTLADAEPIDPRPARSEHWAKRAEEHQAHDHHKHMRHEAQQPEVAPARNAEAPDDAVADDFDGQLAHVLRAYFRTVDALAADDFETAMEAMKRMQARLKQLDAGSLSMAERERWAQIHQPLEAAVQRFLNAPLIEAARTAFEPISEHLEQGVRTFGSRISPVYRAHCPMAFGRGANWLQPYEQITNPYYGAQMLRCGSITGTLVAADDADAEN